MSTAAVIIYQERTRDIDLYTYLVLRLESKSKFDA